MRMTCMTCSWRMKDARCCRGDIDRPERSAGRVRRVKAQKQRSLTLLTLPDGSSSRSISHADEIGERRAIRGVSAYECACSHPTDGANRVLLHVSLSVRVNCLGRWEA